MKTRILFASLALAAMVYSCKEEKHAPVCDGSTPTYESDIKAIIADKCSGSSCHGSGSSRGDFTTFATLAPFLTNGKFESEVLSKQSMPRGGSIGNEKLDLIQCWVENGFPEN